MGKFKKVKHLLENVVMVFKEKNYIPVVQEKEDGKLLEGKTALIVGGTGGIGSAIAKKLSSCGCNIVIAGSNETKLSDALSANPSYLGLVINLNDVKSFDSDIESASKRFGKIDILVNAAGVHVDRPGYNLLAVTEDDYDRVMNLNLKGNYFLCQAVAKYMINNKIQGHILIISSHRALEPSWSPYRLSKCATEGMVRGFAQQLMKYDIVVNAIGPGPTATTMMEYESGKSIYTTDNPLGRMAMPEEIAEYAKLLVSDLGSTVIGDTLYMSGGGGITNIS